MIDDLKRDSNRWRQDQDRRSRSGRGTGTPDPHRNPPWDGSNAFGSVSYAEMKVRQEADDRDTMEVDDYPYDSTTARHYDIDPRDPRHGAGRHGVLPVSTTGYAQDPHPAYSLAAVQPGKYTSGDVPRYGGGSTPPTTRTMAPGYNSQAPYSGRSSAATAPPMQAYRDPRTGQMVTPGYDAPYADQGRSRHGR